MIPENKLSMTQFIIRLIRPYRLYLCVFVVVGLLWSIINTLLPYTLKMIIDRIVDVHGDSLLAFNAIKPIILVYVLLWVGFCLNMRFGDWARLKLFPSLREDTMNQMFSYLNKHSYAYFQNNFAGSLINKIIDMQGAIIDILTILDDVYAQVLGLSVEAHRAFVAPFCRSQEYCGGQNG